MNELMAQVASIDHDQVYFGLGDPVPVSALKSGDRVFGDPALKDAIAVAKLLDVIWIAPSCDFTPDKYGKYRLVAPDGAGKVWRFEPLPQEQQKQEAAAPTLERAFYDFVTGGTAAPSVAAWTKSYVKTMDAKGVKLGAPIAASAAAPQEGA